MIRFWEPSFGWGQANFKARGDLEGVFVGPPPPFRPPPRVSQAAVGESPSDDPGVGSFRDPSPGLWALGLDLLNSSGGSFEACSPTAARTTLGERKLFIEAGQGRPRAWSRKSKGLSSHPFLAVLDVAGLGQ